MECRSRLFDTGLLEEPNKLVCGTANTAHSGAFSERTRFRAPSWARSVQVSISDDSGDPVGFRVYFDNDAIDDYRFTNSSCAQRATLNLKVNTKRISVARPITSGCGARPALHTTGVVKATFSSRPAADPSPRAYIGGCSVEGVQAIVSAGFSGSTCTYTASKPGGYVAVAVGMWRIEIVRGNDVIELDTVNAPPCSEKGHIRPADRVTAQLFGAGYVGVGDDVHC